MAERKRPFYVGYLPLPGALKGFLIRLVLVVFIADIALALLLFWGQEGRPAGAWAGEGEVAYIGQFQALPYPILRSFATGTRPSSAVLLVGEGKAGPPAGLEALDGAIVEVRGYPIERGDLIVLQLAGLPVRQDASQLPPLPMTAPEPATLTGEVVDSKCYAGAMVPGEGKAHQSCGAFCLYGGIPPLFVAPGSDGTPRWYLMAGADGGPIDPAVRALVGRPVRLEGTIRRGAGLALFMVAPDHLAAP